MIFRQPNYSNYSSGLFPSLRMLSKLSAPLRDLRGHQKKIKRYIHRSFLNSHYSSITNRKIFTKKKKKLPYITSFIPQNHKHLPFPLPHSFLKIISTYNISTSLIFSKSSQAIHHTLIDFHKIITTNHIIILFIPLNHNHLSHFTSSVLGNHI